MDVLHIYSACVKDFMKSLKKHKLTSSSSKFPLLDPFFEFDSGTKSLSPFAGTREGWYREVASKNPLDSDGKSLTQFEKK